jgi:hypothetical protein
MLYNLCTGKEPKNKYSTAMCPVHICKKQNKVPKDIYEILHPTFLSYFISWDTLCESNII